MFDERPNSSPASLLNRCSRLARFFQPIPSMLRNRLLNTAGEVSWIALRPWLLICILGLMVLNPATNYHGPAGTRPGAQPGPAAMGRGVSVPNPLGLAGKTPPAAAVCCVEPREGLCFFSPSFGLQGLHERIDHACARPRGVRGRGGGLTGDRGWRNPV